MRRGTEGGTKKTPLQLTPEKSGFRKHNLLTREGSYHPNLNFQNTLDYDGLNKPEGGGKKPQRSVENTALIWRGNQSRRFPPSPLEGEPKRTFRLN
jgi:hypothetical protein